MLIESAHWGSFLRGFMRVAVGTVRADWFEQRDCPHGAFRLQLVARRPAPLHAGGGAAPRCRVYPARVRCARVRRGAQPGDSRVARPHRSESRRLPHQSPTAESGARCVACQPSGQRDARLPLQRNRWPARSANYGGRSHNDLLVSILELFTTRQRFEVSFTQDDDVIQAFAAHAAEEALAGRIQIGRAYGGLDHARSDGLRGALTIGSEFVVAISNGP